MRLKEDQDTLLVKEQKKMKRKTIKDFILYLVVGGVATLTEWIIFYLLEKISVYYMAATVIAYILSTFANWGAGRLLVFKVSKKSFIKEISEIYLAATVGLILNLTIMWVFVDLLNINDMLSKIIATAIVFVFNFTVRKKLIYKI